jgi:hypothetical protein
MLKLSLFRGDFMRVLPLILCSAFLLLGCQPQKDLATVDLGPELALYEPQKLSEFLESQKITEEQRQVSISALRQAFKTSYIGYDLKKSLIGESGDEIFEKCLNDKVAAPMSSTDFYDQIRKCLARFKDSHINLRKGMTTNGVLTGVGSAMWIDDKLIITTIRLPLLEKLETLGNLPLGTLTGAITVGAEILEIDGRPAQEVAQELEAFVGGSSPGAVKMEAASFLFARGFYYPKKSNIQLKIRLSDNSEQEVTLPWLVSTNSGNVDSSMELSERGIEKLADIKSEESLNSRDGFYATNSVMLNRLESHEYLDGDSEDADSAIRTGFATLNGQSVCYLKLLTFNIDEGKKPIKYPVYEVVDKKAQEFGYVDVVKGFLKSCEAIKAPLVFDLRNNVGGSSRLGGEISAAFENAETPRVYQHRATFMGPGNLPTLMSYLEDLNPTETAFEAELYFEAYQQGVSAQSPYSAWASQAYLKDETGLFTGKVLVLISPDCVSACDNTARRFKATGRGVLVGEPTNGTGFGFLSDKTSGGTLFRDPFNLYQVLMPNSAFQTSLLPTAKVFLENAEEIGAVIPFTEIPLLENHPTLPDIELKLTREDLEGGGFKNYLEKLSEILFGPTLSSPEDSSAQGPQAAE